MKKNNKLDQRILKALAKGLSYRAIAKKEIRALTTIYDRHQKMLYAQARELNEKAAKRPTSQ